MLIELTGNILECGATSFVNPVNCHGVMGKGLALAFKIKYPKNYQAYKTICDQRKLKPGDIFPYYYTRHRITIYNFATKKHWKDPSNIEWIKQGLTKLKKVLINDLEKMSIAVPALGCGNGKLKWEEVYPLIQQELGCDELSERLIYIFPPS